MVANTTYGKHLVTVVLYYRNDILVKPISPAFVNQTEPVLNRENGMYMYLCVCVWHLFFLWRIPTGCWWFAVLLFLSSVASLRDVDGFVFCECFVHRDTLCVLFIFFFFFFVVPFIGINNIRHQFMSDHILVVKIDEFDAFHIF